MRSSATPSPISEPEQRPRLGQAAQREGRLLLLAAGFVAAQALALSLAPAARANLWSAGLSAGHWLAALAWALCASAASFSVNRRLPARDPYLLPAAFLLSGWGVGLIWRLAPAFGLRQTAWLVIATAALIGVVYLPGDLRWLRRYRYTWLLAGLALTALTLIFGINPSGAGQRLWLGCCGLYFQPAEALKLLLVAFLAAFLADRRTGQEAVRPHNLLPMLLMWGFSIVVLVSQRDLGMSTLFFAVFLTMLYLATGRARYVLAGAALLGLAGALGYFLFSVVRVRVHAWWDPWADPSGGAFQIVQSLIAIAAGGVLGRGPGMGSPGLIPIAHSDFIFAALAEEWGLVGAVAAIALLALVILRGLRIALAARSPFETLLAAGLSALTALQTLMIAGGVLKLIPLTGLTLPFLSYGGSSLLTHFIAIGLLLRLSATASPER